MKTLNELLDLARQGKLDEIDTLAALAQGWRKIGNEGDSDWATPNKEGCETVVRHYHPTRDKAQAMCLLEELIDIGYAFVKVRDKYAIQDCEHISLVEFKDPLIAVTIAFILAKQGEE